MRFFLATLFILFLFDAHASAKFIGKSALYKCAVVKSITITRSTGNAETDIAEHHVYINPSYFGKQPPIVQQFIYQHECGHAHGILKEDGADRYAFYALESHINKKVVQEICDTGIPRERCNNLKALEKKRENP